MTREALHALIDSYMQAWNSRNPATIASYHSADGVAESPMYATMHGRRAIEDAARAFFTSFPDAEQKTEAVIVDPPHAAVFGSARATHVNEFFGLPGTGRRIEFRTSWLLRVDGDGHFAHVRRIYDFTGVLVQLGVLRAKPAKP